MTKDSFNFSLTSCVNAERVGKQRREVIATLLKGRAFGFLNVMKLEEGLRKRMP